MEFVDTHAHLTDARYDGDREAMLARAAEAGVRTLVTIGMTIENTRAALELVRGRREAPVRLFATAGYHPHEAGRYDPARENELRALLAEPEVVAAGEMGLDYHYDFAPRAAQQRAFERQIALAAEADLPIVIHCREAFDDIVAVLRAHAHPRLRGVFHCFSEGPAQADTALELGFVLGIGGIATFKNGEEVRAAAARAGLDHLVLETDAPYLAPVPKRGQRNEPAYVAYVARFLAQHLGVTLEELGARTTANARRLYALPDA